MEDTVSSQRKTHKKHVSYWYLLLGILLCVSAPLAFAKNLGVEGSVYSIVEPDMLSGIRQKLIALQKSGELERQKAAVIQRTVQHLLRPVPVAGVHDLPPGKKPVTRTFDPSLALNQDIKSVNGAIIAHKGTRINPLDTMRFHERLVFINGDNDRQIQWLVHSLRIAQQRAATTEKIRETLKIILVNGNIQDAATALHHRVYFDQRGTLCRHFNIVHTPTVVYQPNDGKGSTKRLVVREVQVD